jgi:hypothetical protein
MGADRSPERRSRGLLEDFSLLLQHPHPAAQLTELLLLIAGQPVIASAIAQVALSYPVALRLL